MEAYQGYFENGQFIPLGNFKIPDKKRVILTVLDEAPRFPAMNDLAAWDSFFSKIKAAEDESVPDFERIHLNREVDL